MSRVIVVGGGIIGAACAYYLSRSGGQVTLVDSGEFGKGCSHANCGFVCPSHVLPLAMPGTIGRTLKAILSSDSPFSIKPRLSLSLMHWLLSFAGRCNSRDMMRSAEGIQALLRSSRSLYDDWMREEILDCEWQTSGLLFVFQSRHAMDHYAQTDRLLSESFGMPARRLDGEAVNELEPALRTGLAGGWLYEGDAHLRPDRLMASLRNVLVNHGVSIREHCQVTDVSGISGRAAQLRTSQGDLPADDFVFATGAWTPLLSRALGGRIPIQPGKGYSITMARPEVCPTYPLVFEEHRVAVTPMQSGYRLGSIMEFAGYDSSLQRRRLDLLRKGASHYLREPSAEPVEEEWFGWRPMTPDSKPIVGLSPNWNNVWIAAGHNMLGLSMAPATGKLLAELVNGQPPHLDPEPYSVQRF